MSKPVEDTNLLMVHADEFEPVLRDPLPSSEADATTDGGYDGPSHLWDESREANDLFAQGWGVIAPQGPEGDELLKLISPLIAHRKQQQGNREIKIYRVPPKQDQAEASLWRKQVYEPSVSNRKNLPRYLLLLGDLDAVSAELQMVLAADGFVGRLAFDQPQDYETYVEKLLRWENASPTLINARAVFHTVQDRTKATEAGHRSLMVPGLSLAREYQKEGAFNSSTMIEVEHGFTPKPQPLVEEAIKNEPGLLFTISHGAGAPRRGWGSSEEQRRFQGGMSFGRSGGLLTGEALAGQTFMPGGVWFMLACFGAGTPATSKYEKWLQNLSSAGHFSGDLESVGASLATDERPFIASIPKSVLASPGGPLAFIGHVDLAWTYAFRELDTERPVDRPNRFIDVFGGILRRDRVGVAFRELLRHFGSVNTELTALVETGSTDSKRKYHLWMLRQDLAGYILLGDPAVHLPIKSPEIPGIDIDPVASLGLPSVDLSASLGMPVSQQAPPESTGPDIDADLLERAIGRALVGDDGTRKILAESELDLGRREFQDMVERYRSAGRRALGLPED